MLLNKIVLGIIVGLSIGVAANPLMPPAFFIVGGLAIWWFTSRPKKEDTRPEEEDRG